MYELLKTIYLKHIYAINTDLSMNIALTTVLSKQKNNLTFLNNIVQYLYYINPIHYFYLLYFCIPQSSYVPKSLKINKIEEKENKVYNRIKQLFNWSDRELELNKTILNKTIDNKFWKKEFNL
jgi:hypothetical protein